jgi:cytochrome c peroxidase
MHVRHAVLFAFVLPSCLLARLAAQADHPRFHLPDKPFDYESVVAPEAGLYNQLRGWNDKPPAEVPGVVQTCGTCGGFSLRSSCRAARVTNERATLGRVLFYDRRLSRNHRRSCSSCHEQARGFADGRAFSRGFAGRRTRRNSMSIANLAFRLPDRMFWDGRASGLEEMVLRPIQDGVEMGLDLPTLVRRLTDDPAYAPLFENAFGDRTVTCGRISQALAAFLRSMVSLWSRFDKGIALAGDFDKEFPNFSPAENRGRQLFFGLSEITRERSCASCHMQDEPQWCGSRMSRVIFQASSSMNNGLDGGLPQDDPGVGRIDKDDASIGCFRVPSLRNVELTGPYMHDGRFKTLEDVVAFYSNKVRPHRNLDLRLVGKQPSHGVSWDGPARAKAHEIKGRLGYVFTSKDRRDLVAFLKTLTDWEFIRDPRFADPFRKPAR